MPSRARCTVPTCRKVLNKHERFMCGTHWKLIPQVLADAVVKTTIALHTPHGELEHDPKIHDYRMARALAFAHVCDHLHIDTEDLIQKAISTDAPPEAKSIRNAIRKVITGGK